MEHHRRAVIDGVASSKNRDSKGGELNLGMGKKEQVIRWERFLPRRFLRVLLVENDDCTRHIVAALLRKCSYQVAAVADGLKAWEVLKEKCYNFDLVLTEVVMPSLSGIGLLSKIMSNDICKNIPVIMMSSHDSIGIVFKCMLKGAADFLVKPVRKNELRNLWQHVWRKCCSNSCGNGSENGIPNWPKLEAVADNDVDSNHGSANAGNRSETGDGSDEESDTQSSCSKPETGIKSIQNLREPFESEYMSLPEEIGSTSEKHDFDMAKAVFPLSMHEKGKAKDKSTGVEIKVTSPIGGPASTKNFWEKNGFYDGFPCREEDLASVRSKDGGITDLEPLDQIKEANEPSKEIIDFVGATTNERCRFPILEDNDHGKDILCKNGKSSDVKRCTYNSGPLQLLELSLRRPQLKCWDDEVFQEKHVLNHSDSSAFSRYCGVSMHHSCPTSGSSASLSIRTSDFGAANCHINSGTDNGRSLTFPLLERMLSPRRNGTEALICCQMSSGGNKEGAGTSASGTLRENAFVGHSSIEKTVFPHPQLGALQIHIPVGAIPSQSLSAGYGALMQPNFNPEPSVPPYGSSEVEKETKLRLSKPFTRDLNHLVNDLQHVNCHPCFENHHPHRLKQGMEEQRANIKFACPRAVLHTPCEIKDQVDDYGHGLTDASGSNGSNEDTSVAVNTGAALDSGNEDGLQNCNGKVSDHDYSRREAALTRFRLKRKDRCFEKKVRYHSRKKLAEKRSRLKGQFVRQSVTELTMIAAEQDD